MSRAYLAALLLPSLFAQTPSNPFDKAPPEVDEALRARVTQFYQAHVDGKFRKAEEVVAEDTKDYYYESKKARYLSFAIDHIVYSDNFTKATAFVNCEMMVNLPGFNGRPMKFPLPSFWKVEDGKWFWYVDTKAEQMTPFGPMKGGPSGPAAALPSLKNGPDVDALWKGVSVDKTSVQLSSYEPSSGTFVITNKMKGNIGLSLEFRKPAGLFLQLDKERLKEGEQAKLTFLTHPDKETVNGGRIEVKVRVLPTNQLIPLEVLIR